MNTNLVNLRPANIEDIRKIYEWRNNEVIVELSLSGSPIVWDDHKPWFEGALLSEDVLILIIENVAEQSKRTEVGELRFDRNGIYADVTIFILPDFIGRGLGVEALRMGCRHIVSLWKNVKFVRAKILNRNLRSKKAFEKAGFSRSFSSENHTEMLLEQKNG